MTSYSTLFGGTVEGFLASAALVLSAAVPDQKPGRERPFRERLTRGIRLYLAMPRLRGLLALTLGAAAAGAFVIVNTVVLVRSGQGGSNADVAAALAAFGGGSMLAALLLPGLLRRVPDRPVMLLSDALLTGAVAGLGGWLMWAPLGQGALLAIWALLGLLCAAILTPSGRLLRRSAHAEDRPAIFAAQFALSHACWLVTIPWRAGRDRRLAWESRCSS